jgi:hypothetical protein
VLEAVVLDPSAVTDGEFLVGRVTDHHGHVGVALDLAGLAAGGAAP